MWDPGSKQRAFWFLAPGYHSDVPFPCEDTGCHRVRPPQYPPGTRTLDGGA